MKVKTLKKRLIIFVILVALIFMLLVGRLSYMQLFEVDKYNTLATQNHQRLIPVEAPRGEILDKNGVSLVYNKPVSTVSLAYLGGEEEKSISKLAEILQGEDAFSGLSQEEIVAQIKEKLENQQRLYEPIKVASNISSKTVNIIEEMKVDLPGVSIEVSPIRYYPYDDLLGEVLGYVREITDRELKDFNADLEENPDSVNPEEYVMGDLVGKVGIEKSYEEYLRGEKGTRIIEVDALARPVREIESTEPTPGNNLKLTIDSRLQRVAQNSLQNALDKVKYLYLKSSSVTPMAALVVQDVNTGAVLAMASMPSYDLNIFSGILSTDLFNELSNSRSLLNHAIQTPIAPGSTFKMASATSFLESGTINAYTSIYDSGSYKTKNCWLLSGHGSVNVITSLKYSCDTFFYIFGERVGPEIMGQYAREYGFGQLTRVDLPNEEKGAVASEKRKKELWSNYPDLTVRQWESKWHGYDSMDMAIGQQETRVTALQLVNYVSSIANGGILYRPYLVEQAISPSGKVILQNEPEVLNKVNASSSNIKILQRGMREVVLPGGTAHSVFTGGFKVAAKSGTAELGDAYGHNNALFVAYAPYDNPEVAVSVIVEYGSGGGKVAGPIANEILNAYFSLKEED